jgi:hypothetical protein
MRPRAFGALITIDQESRMPKRKLPINTPNSIRYRNKNPQGNKIRTPEAFISHLDKLIAQDKLKGVSLGPKRLWTEERAHKLLDEYFTWQNENPRNIYMCDYLAQNRLNRSLFEDLCTDYPSIRERRAEDKQTIARKLQSASLNGYVKERTALFLLNCKYGYVPENKIHSEQNIRQQGNVSITYETVGDDPVTPIDTK